jgi:hypothetical protein
VGYSGRRDSTRFSSDELKESEINDVVRAISALMKKTDIPKEFGTERFSKAHPRTEVHVFLEHAYLLELVHVFVATSE